MASVGLLSKLCHMKQAVSTWSSFVATYPHLITGFLYLRRNAEINMNCCLRVACFNHREGVLIPWVFVSVNEGGGKEEVQILGNLRQHWRRACRRETDWTSSTLGTHGKKWKHGVHREVVSTDDRVNFHTCFVFSPGQDPRYILPDEGVGFHHQAHLRWDE